MAMPWRSRALVSRGREGSPGDSAAELWELGARGQSRRSCRRRLTRRLKLESALARLRTESRVAVLHYAPIRATVENEPPEIYPFLGCGRLEEPLNRYPVTAVVHGHAHHGSPQGQTATGVPVYNVSLPLMRSIRPGQPPFLILELPADAAGP